MGLKTTNYKVEDYNLVLPTAYAKITNIEISPDGDAFTTFAIQQTREDISNNKPLIELRLDCKIDKSLPIYEQIYTISKAIMFKNWEDDIVEEVEVIETDYIEEEIHKVEKTTKETKSEVE